MKRYHWLLVSLHWLIALLVLLSLFAGGLLLSHMPNSDPAKVGALAGHMIIGITIGVLLLLRLAARLGSTKPARATTGNRILDTVAIWTHWGLYLLVALVVLSGLSTSVAAGLPDIVFSGSGAPLPVDFHVYSARQAHGILTKLLLALACLHIAAACYHQFVLRDGLIGRMWYGKRT